MPINRLTPTMPQFRQPALTHAAGTIPSLHILGGDLMREAVSPDVAAALHASGFAQQTLGSAVSLTPAGVARAAMEYGT